MEQETSFDPNFGSECRTKGHKMFFLKCCSTNTRVLILGNLLLTRRTDPYKLEGMEGPALRGLRLRIPPVPIPTTLPAYLDEEYFITRRVPRPHLRERTPP